MGLSRLGRYTLLEPLGAGGMAEVHVARRDGSPEICALKRLLPEIVAHPTAGPRFLREAHLVSFLHHPGIARVQGAGTEGDSFCIEMEFIAGATLGELGERLQRDGRRLPPEVVLTIGIGALDALAHAHTARGPDGAPLQVVHRDLTPRNVMVDATGRTKIIDFGVARASVDEFKTQPGVIIGSLRYFSPEQARADPVDARSDLYSLAVTLHEALTGRALVALGGSAFDTLRAVLEAPAPLASDVAPVPRRLAEVLARALAKKPSERWPTAAAFRDALIATGLARASERSIGELVRGELPERLALVEGWRATARALHAAEESPPEAALTTRAGDQDTGDGEVHTQPDSVPTQLTHGGELVPTHLARSHPPAPLVELLPYSSPRPTASARRSFALGALGGGGLVAAALALALARGSGTAPVEATVVPTPVAPAPVAPAPTTAPTALLPVEPPTPVKPEVAPPAAPAPAPRDRPKPRPAPARPKALGPARAAPLGATPAQALDSPGGAAAAHAGLERRLRQLADTDVGQLDAELSRAARDLKPADQRALQEAIVQLRASGGRRAAADAAIDTFLAIKSASR